MSHQGMLKYLKPKMISKCLCH